MILGKSSLLMALAGLIKPSDGMVVLDSQRLENYTPQERAQRIGYLPQEAEVAWDVAVENLVRLGRMPYRDRGDHDLGFAGNRPGAVAGYPAGRRGLMLLQPWLPCPQFPGIGGDLSLPDPAV